MKVSTHSDPSVHLFIDQYKTREVAQQSKRKVDAARIVGVLGTASNLLGVVTERLAVIDGRDREAQEAFAKAGFDVRSMNGDRPRTIHDVIGVMQSRLQTDVPKYLVAVTNDPVFHYFFQDAMNHDTELRVLVPGQEIPRLFRTGDYNVRFLNEIVPEPKPTRYDIRIDFENVWIGLERNGISVSPKQLIEAIKQKAADLGDVGMITAYADWDLLSRNSRYNLQRELALISGVETRYQPNENSKNSADMVIVDHIRNLIEKPSNAPDAVDIIILSTGDRDFRQIVETAQDRGKKVILFAVKGTLSNELKDAADDLYYLDDLLPKSKAVDFNQHPKPSHPQAQLAMTFLAFLKRRHWGYAYANRVDEVLGPNAEAQLNEAVGVQVLKKQENKFSPNYQHPLTQACQHLLKWVPWRLKLAKERRGFAEVYASYLFKEMKHDRKLHSWQIGRDWDEAADWLDLMDSAGAVVKGSLPHPYKPGERIITWSLPGTATSIVASEADANDTEPESTAHPDETGVSNSTPNVEDPDSTSSSPEDTSPLDDDDINDDPLTPTYC